MQARAHNIYLMDSQFKKRYSSIFVFQNVKPVVVSDPVILGMRERTCYFSLESRIPIDFILI
jgi:hypothetical protein